MPSRQSSVTSPTTRRATSRVPTMFSTPGRSSRTARSPILRIDPSIHWQAGTRMVAAMRVFSYMVSMLARIIPGLAMALLTAGLAHADIVIGAAGPISGQNADLGEQLRRGAEKAVADINSAG